MWAGSRRKISDSLLVPSRSRPISRLRMQHSCPESTFTHNCKVQDGQTHIHPPLLHSSTVYYPPLAHQSSVVAAPSAVTAPLPANHATCHCHSEQMELLNQKLAAAEEVNVMLFFYVTCNNVVMKIAFLHILLIVQNIQSWHTLWKAAKTLNAMEICRRISIWYSEHVTIKYYRFWTFGGRCCLYEGLLGS
jgi:hypothetical protein